VYDWGMMLIRKQLLNRFSINSLSGFTLIELLVSVGVLGIIASISITAFLSLSSSYDKANVITRVNHEGTRIMELLVRVIRNASDAQLVGNALVLTIPKELSNLEYSSNGNCTQVELVVDTSTTNAFIKKYTDVSLSPYLCAGTPICSDSNPCKLTSDDVHVRTLSFNVVPSNLQPDQVTITFELQQSKSLSDPEQKTALEFKRTVSTRGY